MRNPFRKTPPDTTPNELVVIGRNDAKTLAAQALVETILDEKAKARQSPLPDIDAEHQANRPWHSTSDAEHRVNRLWHRAAELNTTHYANLYGHTIFISPNPTTSWMCQTCNYGGRAEWRLSTHDSVAPRKMMLDIVDHVRLPTLNEPKAEWRHERTDR